VPHALAAGMAQATIDATRTVPLAADAPLSPTERVAMRLTDTMTRDIEVPDALFAEIRTHFGAQAQIDLVATIAAYNMVSRFLVALQIGH
jgi:4-carboxymuconolactone decarboxylase